MPSEDPDERSPPTSRRRLLRAGGTLAAALASSTAGCIATLPPLGRRVRYGRVDAPEPGPPAYRRWLPAPSAFQGSSGEGDGGVERLLTATPGNLGADVAGERFAFGTDILRRKLDHVGVGYENYDRVVWYDPAFVAAGDVDRSAVRETLAPTGYWTAGTYRGFDLYSRDDLPRAVAVGDSTVVFVRGAGGVRDAKAVVDAIVGAAPRYHEVNETFARLSEAVGASPFTWFFQDDDADHSAHTSSFTFDEESVYYVWHRIYPEGETPSKSEIQRELEDEKRPREALDVDVEIDGRVVTIENRQGHARFRESNDEDVPPPQVTWGLDHDRDAETVTLGHEAGDPVPADRLAVEYAPILHDGDEPGIGTQFADEYDTVAPGDAITFDVSDWPVDTPPETELRVVWTSPDGSEEILLQYEHG